ncbi:MAG: hypothetical protein K6G00_06970 [Treponema sp.]|nr:hypothetical protein [Treponema sp.]
MARLCIRTFFFFTVILYAILNLSCAGGGTSSSSDSSTVSFSLSSSDFSRNITQEQSFDGYYAVVSMCGDCEETKTLRLTSGGQQSVSFDDIPVGSEIWGEVQVYHTSYSDVYFHRYSGKSNAVVIPEGETVINVSLHNMIADDLSTKYGDTSINIGTFALNLYPSTGKFAITCYSYSIAEGTYTGSAEAENLALKVYTYRPYSTDPVSLDSADIAGTAFVILEQPLTISTSNSVNSMNENVVQFTDSSGYQLSFTYNYS